MRIGILTDSENKVASFEEGGTIKIFEKREGGWTVAGSYEYRIEGLDNTRLFHERLHEVCEWMKPCRILGARRFRGTYRAIFEKYDISMCELDESKHLYAGELLDSLTGFHEGCAQERSPVQASVPDKPPEPVQTAPGTYSIDLTEVMEHKTAFNSKQILLPFIQAKNFDRLEVICGHVPKWFENELKGMNFQIDNLAVQDKLHILIWPE